MLNVPIEEGIHHTCSQKHQDNRSYDDYDHTFFVLIDYKICCIICDFHFKNDTSGLH